VENNKYINFFILLSGFDLSLINSTIRNIKNDKNQYLSFDR